MNKKIIFGGVVLLFLVFFSFSVSADFLPSTDPCRVIGSVTVDGAAAQNGLTIKAVPSISSTKSTTTSGGNYNLNAIGATNGETVTLYLEGISTGMTFDFVPYCNSSATEPWIIKNIVFSTKSDGTTGCTSDAVCSGGHCVNPGATGVCSSNTYYCNSDGTCDAAFGETTSTCSADCHSGGGSGSGGSTYTPPYTPPTNPSETSPEVTIPAGETGSFSFSELNTGLGMNLFDVYEVDITVQNSASGTVTITQVDQPTGSPLAIASADGEVYAFAEITPTIPNSNIQNATIRFKVTKSWTIEHNIDPAAISIKKLINNEWVEYPTVKTSEDSTYYYYETVVYSFSNYVIVGKYLNTTTPANNVTLINTTTPIENLTPTPTTPVVTPPTKTNKINNWLLFLVVCIAAFVLIIVLTSPSFSAWGNEQSAKKHKEKAKTHREHALKATTEGHYEKALVHHKLAEKHEGKAKAHLKHVISHHHKIANKHELKGNHEKAEEHRAKARHYESQ